MTELERAYRASTYRIFLPGGQCELRLDQASETLRSWLKMAGASEFAILTAHNPGSQQLDLETNMAHQSQMEIELLTAGHEPYAGENESDAGDWPVEESCFVSAIGLTEAKAIGAKYAQRAIVYGAADGIPRLFWIEK